MKLRFLLFSVLVLILFSFYCNKKTPTKNDYSQLIREHPTTDILNYPQRDGDWNHRVHNIDESRINFIKKVNEIDGFEEVPIHSSSLPEMKSKIDLISKSLHPDVKKLFDKYVYAVYFCEKLGGTGLTGFIYDNTKNKPVGGFIVIDSAVIQKKANDWISYKEKSVFSAGNITLEIRIENDDENTTTNALRYILLHEMGHVISNTLGITPDLREKSSDYTSYSFFNKVWITMDKSIYDQKIFPLRTSVTFYASVSAALNLDENWNKIYPVLEKTSFPTLYGATNALDHFAETFVSYVHCIIDNRPWELTLTKNEKVIYRMKNRIHELEEEKEIIKKIIFE